jgi:recombination protein RecA
VLPEKTKRLEQTAQAIQERWGARALRSLDALIQADFPHVATRFPLLDRALGIGGIPRGRITEIAGMPTSGTGSLMLRTMASAQAEGDMAVYVDAGRTFDPLYAARCGVNLDRLLLVRPSAYRDGLHITHDLVASGGAGLLVFDLGTDPGSALTEPLDWLVSPLAGSPCALVFLIPLSRQPAAPARDRAAGLALAHYATLRLKVEKQRWLRRRQDVRGYRTRVTILKNKLAPPGRPVTLTISVDRANP